MIIKQSLIKSSSLIRGAVYKWIIIINFELLLFTNKHNMYSFMSKHFDNNNIINNHMIKITHYQIFVVVYQDANILKISTSSRNVCI